MANPEVWRSVQVLVESIRAAAKTITAISNANPGVVDITGHGYSDGDYVLLKVKGMNRLDYRVVRIDNKTTDDFELEGVDTTNLGTFVSGTAEKITFGTAAATFTDVTPGGGDAQKVTVDLIHSDQAYDIPVGFNSASYGFGSLWDTSDVALLALRGFFDTQDDACVQFVFKSGKKLLFNGFPAVNLAPGGSAGQLVTTPVSIDVRGALTTYAT